MPRLDDGAVEDTSAGLAGESNSDRVDERNDWTLLPNGSLLSLSDASRVLEAVPAQIIMFVGEKKVGKTTLLAELHHAFLAGPVGDQLFAGSITLPAFENFCFRSRIRSRRSRGETTRTSLAAGVKVLHLRVRNKVERTPATNLLLADTSGEAFKAMRMRKEEVDVLAPLLVRADAVVVLTDGRKIASPQAAQQARTNTRTLIRVLLERRAVSASSALHLVITKWDEVVRAGATAGAEAHFQEVTETFGSSVGTIDCHRVAARPHPQARLERYFGLPDLLAALLRPVPKVALNYPRLEVPSTARSYLRFRNGGTDV